MENIGALLPLISVVVGLMIAYVLIREAVTHGIINAAKKQALSQDGPGWFTVKGTDAKTRMATSWNCEAENSASAQHKAELEGIIVTRIARRV